MTPKDARKLKPGDCIWVRVWCNISRVDFNDTGVFGEDPSVVFIVPRGARKMPDGAKHASDYESLVRYGHHIRGNWWWHEAIVSKRQPCALDITGCLGENNVCSYPDGIKIRVNLLYDDKRIMFAGDYINIKHIKRVKEVRCG